MTFQQILAFLKNPIRTVRGLFAEEAPPKTPPSRP